MTLDTHIDLLRHGECEGGYIFRGSTDVALTTLGHEQMCDTLAKAKNLCPSQHHSSPNNLIQNDLSINQHWNRVISSPLRRCREFAKSYFGDTVPIDINDALQEYHFGEWEGKDFNWVWENDKANYCAWKDRPDRSFPPGGEKMSSFKQRVSSCFDKIVQQHAGNHLLLVAHGGVIRVILNHVLNIPLQQINNFDVPFACLSRILITKKDHTPQYKLIFHNPFP